MTEEIIITLTDIHKIDNQKEKNESTIRGKLETNNGGYTITYDEKDLDSSTTTVHLSCEKILTVTRHGSYSMHLVMQENKRHVCPYATPAGTVQLGVSAEHIKSNMQDTAGTLDFEYTLDLNGEILSKNRLILQIRRTS